MSWMQTFTGRRLNLLDPLQDEISIVDIACALSNLCRFTGHTSMPAQFGRMPVFYSVAQHSVHVSEVVTSKGVMGSAAWYEDKRWGLLHDASEAYMNDVNSPLKGHLPKYKDIERRLMWEIMRKFGLSPHRVPESVHRADWAVGATEAFQLIEGSKDGWRLQEKPADIKILPWSPKTAHDMFMYRFRELFPDYME